MTPITYTWLREKIIAPIIKKQEHHPALDLAACAVRKKLKAQAYAKNSAELHLLMQQTQENWVKGKPLFDELKEGEQKYLKEVVELEELERKINEDPRAKEMDQRLIDLGIIA